MTFQQLCGLPSKDPITSVVRVEREVPVMLKDPLALLLQFVLLLPLHLDQSTVYSQIFYGHLFHCLRFSAYFTSTVQMVYNLLYYQVVAQVSCGLTSAERAKATKEASTTTIKNLSDALGLVNECLGHTDLYMDDEDDASDSGPSSEDDDSNKAHLNIGALEQQVDRWLRFQYFSVITK